MRVLFAYEEFVPSPNTDADHFVHTAAALARLGYDATLVVPRSSRPVEPTAAEVLSYYGTDGPLGLKLVPSFKWQKTLRHLVHAVDVAVLPSLRGYDVTYVQNLEIMAAALQAGHRVFFDHYRPFGDQLPFLQPLLRHWMLHPNFLGAALHSEYCMEAYERLGIPKDRLRPILLGVDPERLSPRLDRGTARQRADLPLDKKVAVYTGTVSEKKGLDLLIEMARRTPDVVFVIVGSKGHGPVERDAEGVDNVIVRPWQPFEDMVPYLHAADVLIMPPSSDPLLKFGRTVLPLKTYLYLGTGCPILAGDTADTRGVLHHGENAWLVKSDDVDAAVTGLRKLLTDEALRKRLSTGALESSALYTYDARAEKLAAFIEERFALEPAPGRSTGWSARDCAAETLSWLRGATAGSLAHGGDSAR